MIRIGRKSVERVDGFLCLFFCFISVKRQDITPNYCNSINFTFKISFVSILPPNSFDFLDNVWLMFRDRKDEDGGDKENMSLYIFYFKSIKIHFKISIDINMFFIYISSTKHVFGFLYMFFLSWNIN
jgi:hypothetical protein